ncbi:MFS transporter [Rhodoplanes elegans]|uniref:MFS transporter n=1 Tax=Rhodoplanes elegans TaxID=29408 RepID=A0A327L1T0_9BRAD|nr:tripartite tricarboxylate transporter substrate binding protein [Rhodoplanes elegans]MBK5959838.1 MFS transporter [Rhodoplanes elegans]RAI41658.1 MFS transporter [Rhodoplanes elegans]
MRVFGQFGSRLAAVAGTAATVALALTASLAFGGTALADDAADYPNRPVRIVVAYPPGGTTDILARIVGQHMSETLGQQFIVENKPGAGNNIGTEMVVNSAPDGYTLLLANPANGINASLYKKLSFNFLRDITPVAGIVRVPNVMEVNPSFPAKTVAEFIEYAKANPGKVNMASSGNGTSVHLSGEMLMAMTGIKMTHVPYRGAGPALTDLIAGTVDVIFDNLPSSIAHIQAGKLRALAVTTDTPSDQLPGVPTVAATVPGYEASAWFGFGAPKGTPPAVVAKLNAAVNKALADPKVKARLVELGGVPLVGPPEAFGKVMKDETEKWEKVVKFSGASVD